MLRARFGANVTQRVSAGLQRAVTPSAPAVAGRCNEFITTTSGVDAEQLSSYFMRERLSTVAQRSATRVAVCETRSSASVSPHVGRRNEW